MGTPDFAQTQLEALLEKGYDVVGAFCQSDKPVGRHQELKAPEVKCCCQEYNIPVYQPKNLRHEEEWELIRSLKPDLIVVAAYGKLLPKEVLEIPPMGCINVHGSLLPKLRGAAPIQRAIIDGDEEAGVTIMKMSEGMDEGDMLLKKSVKIEEGETAEELFDRLSLLGAEALIEAIENFDTLVPEKQDASLATWASPLNKEDGFIDFTDTSFMTMRRFAGTFPWPGAYFMYNGKRVKILEMERSPLSGKIGEILDKKLTIACKEGSVTLLKVGPEGKKPMDGASFMNGQRLKKGDSLL